MGADLQLARFDIANELDAAAQANQLQSLYLTLEMQNLQIKQIIEHFLNVGQDNCKIASDQIVCPLSRPSFHIDTELHATYSANLLAYGNTQFCSCLPYKGKIFSAHGQSLIQSKDLYITNDGRTINKNCFASLNSCGSLYNKATFDLFNICNKINMDTSLFINCNTTLNVTDRQNAMITVGDIPIEFQYDQ